MRSLVFLFFILLVSYKANCQQIRFFAEAKIGKTFLYQSKLTKFNNELYITKITPYRSDFIPSHETSLLAFYSNKSRYKFGAKLSWVVNNYSIYCNGSDEYLDASGLSQDSYHLYENYNVNFRGRFQFIQFQIHNEYNLFSRKLFSFSPILNTGYQKFILNSEKKTVAPPGLQFDMREYASTFKSFAFIEFGGVCEFWNRRIGLTATVKKNLTPVNESKETYRSLNSYLLGIRYNFGKLNIPKYQYPKQQNEKANIQRPTNYSFGIKIGSSVFTKVNTTGNLFIDEVNKEGAQYVNSESIIFATENFEYVQGDFKSSAPGFSGQVYCNKEFNHLFSLEFGIAIRHMELKINSWESKIYGLVESGNEFKTCVEICPDINAKFALLSKEQWKLNAIGGFTFFKSLTNNDYIIDPMSNAINFNSGIQFKYQRFSFQGTYQSNINKLKSGYDESYSSLMQLKRLNYFEILLGYDIKQTYKKLKR